MSDLLFDLFKLYQPKAGRASYAARTVQQLAGDYPEIIAQCEFIYPLSEDAIQKLRTWQSIDKSRALFGPKAMQEDQQLDLTISAFYDANLAMKQAFQARHPKGAAARNILDKALPKGSSALTSLPFVEQEAAVTSLVKLLKGPLATDVATLQFEEIVDRIEACNLTFAAAIAPKEKETLTWDQVKAAEKRCAQAYLQLVATIFYCLPPTSEDNLLQRARIMQPILDQNEAIGRSYRRARPVYDVDPETGQEEPELPVID